MFGNIFKSAKNAVVGALLKKQLANLPKEQREMIETLINKDPELFEKIGKEIEVKVKAGTAQMYASMTVFKKYESQIKKLMEVKEIQ